MRFIMRDEKNVHDEIDCSYNMTEVIHRQRDNDLYCQKYHREISESMRMTAKSREKITVDESQSSYVRMHFCS